MYFFYCKSQSLLHIWAGEQLEVFFKSFTVKHAYNEVLGMGDFASLYSVICYISWVYEISYAVSVNSLDVCLL